MKNEAHDDAREKANAELGHDGLPLWKYFKAFAEERNWRLENMSPNELDEYYELVQTGWNARSALSESVGAADTRSRVCVCGHIPGSHKDFSELTGRGCLKPECEGKCSVFTEASNAALTEDEPDAERARREELEVVAAALYLGHDDAKEQFDMYCAVYLPNSKPAKLAKPKPVSPPPGEAVALENGELCPICHRRNNESDKEAMELIHFAAELLRNEEPKEPQGCPTPGMCSCPPQASVAALTADPATPGSTETWQGVDADKFVSGMRRDTGEADECETCGYSVGEHADDEKRFGICMKRIKPDPKPVSRPTVEAAEGLPPRREVGDKTPVVVVYRDGSHKACEGQYAWEYERDPDYLVTIADMASLLDRLKKIH